MVVLIVLASGIRSQWGLHHHRSESRGAVASPAWWCVFLWQLRQGADDKELRPTPHYTNAILEDGALKGHLALLHALLADAPGLLDAIVLLKVRDLGRWL
jgi:hypothetical protein